MTDRFAAVVEMVKDVAENSGYLAPLFKPLLPDITAMHEALIAKTSELEGADAAIERVSAATARGVEAWCQQSGKEFSYPNPKELAVFLLEQIDKRDSQLAAMHEALRELETKFNSFLVLWDYIPDEHKILVKNGEETVLIDHSIFRSVQEMVPVLAAKDAEIERLKEEQLAIAREYDPNCEEYHFDEQVQAMKSAAFCVEQLQELAEAIGDDPESSLMLTVDTALGKIREQAEEIERLMGCVKLCVGRIQGKPWHEIQDSQVHGYLHEFDKVNI